MVHKAPTTPEVPERAILALLDEWSEPVDVCHGTTVATNLIVQRCGARAALITTAGFRDVLEIRRQNRPDIYDLWKRWPEPLVPPNLRFEAPERVGSDGTTLMPLDRAAVDQVISRLVELDVESIAVCLLFSFLDSRHEQELLRLLRARIQTHVHVSLSSRVLPQPGEYERTSATVLNAYVAPIVGRYLAKLAGGLRKRGSDLLVMNSNGGLVYGDLAAGLPLLTVLSGPAAGVVAASTVARRARIADLITIDVGGTSTDVSIVPGMILHSREAMVGGFPLGVDSIAIETVGAGGGSIASLDRAGVVHVGPESAGADPGPACYGRGGPFTLTDAALILGRIGERLLGGSLRLYREPAEEQARRLGNRLSMDVAQVAWSVFSIAVSNVERSVRRVSLESGHDPRRFVLCAFGGAGPQLACDVADGLAMSRVLVPSHPGVMAALGLLLADIRRDYSRTLLGRSPSGSSLDTTFSEMEEEARSDIGADQQDVRLTRLLDVRYAGQTFALQLRPGDDLVERFHQAHLERFGYRQHERVEVVTARLEAVRPVGLVDPPSLRTTGASRVVQGNRPLAHLEAGGLAFREVPLYNRSQCSTGMSVTGPVIFEQYDSTVVVRRGWVASVIEGGALLLDKL